MTGRVLVLILLCAPLFAGCDAFEKRAAARYAEATTLWNSGEYPAAARSYLSVVRDHPYSGRADDALYWIGVTQFLYLGQTEQAVETLRLVLKRYPRRDMAPQAQWYIAQIYELGYNDYDQAIGEYIKAAEYASPEVREKSLYNLADCFFRTGKIEEARETWTRQIAEFPSGPQATLGYFRLGTVAFAKGELDTATIFYRKSLENKPDDALAVKAKFALAGCLEAGSEPAEALKLYREIAPEYPNPEAIQIKIRALENRIAKKSY